jgi:uncharacterized membrane protein
MEDTTPKIQCYSYLQSRVMIAKIKPLPDFIIASMCNIVMLYSMISALPPVPQLSWPVPRC